MFARLLCLATLSCALTATTAYGGTRDPNVPDHKHLEYGAKFRCVARIICRKESKLQHIASCVIIAPRYVLTAAHAVGECDEFEIKLDTGESFPLAAMTAHPSFGEDALKTTDVAVGRSAREIPLDFYPPLYSKNDEAGKVVSIAGYGITGTFSTGATISDGHKRAGSNIVDAAADGKLVCSVSKGKRTSLEFLIGPGDSGGGLFIGNELCGIHSSVVHGRGEANISRYGHESWHTRLSDADIREWIDSVMAQK